jgi:hypothetical protein
MPRYNKWNDKQMLSQAFLYLSDLISVLWIRIRMLLTFLSHFMLNPDPKPEPKCITVPVPLSLKVAVPVPVPQHSLENKEKEK